MYMKRNVGSVDETLRTAVGAVTGTISIAILTGTLSLPTVLSPVLGIVAIMMLATATVGTCPIYSMFGIDSCSRNSSPS
jgi:lysozyme family protein